MMPEHVRRHLQRILGPEEFAGLGLHGEEPSSTLPGWLQRLVVAAEALPLHDVPPALTQDLYAAFEVVAPMRQWQAVQVHDSRAGQELVGVRGSSGGDGWSMTYSSPVADVVLDVQPDDDGLLDVVGHVLALGEAAVAYRARIEGTVVDRVDGDALGRFRFRGLAPDQYTIVVEHRGAYELTLETDLEEVA